MNLWDPNTISSFNYIDLTGIDVLPGILVVIDHGGRFPFSQSFAARIGDDEGCFEFFPDLIQH